MELRRQELAARQTITDDEITGTCQAGPTAQRCAGCGAPLASWLFEDSSVAELMKLAMSGGLVTVGFFTASLFGPPAGLDSQSPATAASIDDQLQPIAPRRDTATTARDANVALATHTDPSGSRTGGVSTAQWGETWGSAWGDWPARTGESFPAANTPASPPASLTAPPLASTSEQTTTAHRPLSASVPADSTWPQWGAANAQSPQGLRFPEAPPLSPPTSAPLPGEPLSTFAEPPAAGPWASAVPPANAANGPPAQQPWSSFPTGNQTTEPVVAHWDPQPRETNAWEAQPVVDNGGYRWHVVSDGDSLPRLAERYLRDAARSRELYELNRNLLTSPDLLPIGVELRIPHLPREEETIEVFDSRGAAHETARPRRRVVALPALTDAEAHAPVARLRAPQAASDRPNAGYP